MILSDPVALSSEESGSDFLEEIEGRNRIRNPAIRTIIANPVIHCSSK